MRKHYIVKDITDEYIAVVQTEEAIHCKNTTKWIGEINVHNLDETSEGWVIITEEELNKILSSTTIVAEAHG